MKVIDGQGRLFGKINLIDFLAILILVSMLPAFYMGYKIIKEPKKEYTDIELKVQFVKLKPEIAKIVSAGDKELNDKGITIGKLLSTGEIEPYVEEFPVGNSKKLTREDSELKQMLGAVQIRAERRGANALYYKDRRIWENSPIEFRTNKYCIEGLVLLKPEPLDQAFDRYTLWINQIRADVEEIKLIVARLENNVESLKDRVGSLENTSRKRPRRR